MFEWARLTAEQKVKKAKIGLQEIRGFYAFVVLHMFEKPSDMTVTMGVNKYGRMIYSEEYVNSLSFPYLCAGVCHEAMHVILKSFTRIGDRNPKVWNIAADIVINNILLNDEFDLPKDWLIPEDNEYEIFGTTISNIDKKSTEEIYDELWDIIPDEMKKEISINSDEGEDGGKGKGNHGNEGNGKEEGEGLPKTFDDHLYNDDDGKGKDGLTDDKEVEEHWEKVFAEAVYSAKNQGTLPSGMERMLDKILKPEVNWKHVIHKTISDVLPYDFNWKFPSKRSITTGIYMPSSLKETADVVTFIDTSGSIGRKEYTKFISEEIGIAKSFHNLRMTIVTCDAKIHDVYEVRNGNIKKILDVKFHGGGGTSHKPVYEWLEKNKPNCKLVINFTDGYTEFPEKKPKVPTLWVLTEHSVNPRSIPFGRVIKLNGN